MKFVSTCILTLIMFLGIYSLSNTKYHKRSKSFSELEDVINKVQEEGKKTENIEKDVTTTKEKQNKHKSKIKQAAKTSKKASKNILEFNKYKWIPNGVAHADFTFDPADRIKDFSKELSEYYTNIAGYGYCPYKKMVKNQCCKNYFEEDFVFVAAEKIKKDNYNIGIIRSDKFKKVIIATPGTRNVKQLIKELIKSQLDDFEESKSIKVMKYFNQVYEEIKCLIFPLIQKQFVQYPDYQFVFTGHSLGGAIATMLAYGSIKNKVISATEDSPVLITYGQPRTGNDVFANEVMASVPIVFRVVRQGDPVTTCPLCNLNRKKTKCLSNLPEDEFVSTVENGDEFDNQSNLPSSRNYWHIGGLKLFNREYTDYNECDKSKGEFKLDDPCNIRRTKNVDLHTIYSLVHVGKICNISKKFRKS